MLKRFALILATVVAGLLGAVAVSSPAQADDPYWYDTCTGDSLCFYQHLSTGYELWAVSINKNALDVGDCYNFYDEDPEANFEDTIEAWSNRWNYSPRVYVQFFVDRDCDDSSGRSGAYNFAQGEMWGGVVILGISSMQTTYTNPDA